MKTITVEYAGSRCRTVVEGFATWEEVSWSNFSPMLAVNGWLNNSIYSGQKEI